MVSDFLGDPIILLLGSTAIILAAFWLRTRDRRYAKVLAVVAALFVLYLLWDRFGPESAARQMRRKLQEMAAAVKTRDLNAIFEHLSEDFHYGGADRKLLREKARQALEVGELTEVVVWGFKPEKPTRAGPTEKATARIDFLGKFKGTDAGDIAFRSVAVFVLDEDGQWRLGGFQVFPLGSKEEYRLPHLPYR